MVGNRLAAVARKAVVSSPKNADLTILAWLRQSIQRPAAEADGLVKPFQDTGDRARSQQGMEECKLSHSCEM
jgi:hypothetical protein